MCGIVGATAERDVVPILMHGLRCLEYRGYDSAGLAVANGGTIQRARTKGKVAELEALLEATPLSSHSGIAHTRWATHGVPSTGNAHPHLSRDEIAVVHNGIIENHEELRARLSEAGYEFVSETDSEVIGHLIHFHRARSGDFLKAFIAAVNELRGAYAIAATSSAEPERIVGARLGSPLVAGPGIGENFLASDIQALLPVTNRFIYLEEGDVVDISLDGCAVYRTDGTPVDRPVKESSLSASAAERGEYRHFMLKEIFEQPEAVAATLEGRIVRGRVPVEIFGVDAASRLEGVGAVHIIACGTSYHAGLIARHWLESLAGLPCSVEVASEFRYRKAVVPPDTLFVTISQSGETADTLAALRQARHLGYRAALGICNVPESSLVRESDMVLMTHAGPEIGVASTKAFTTQLSALALLALVLAETREGTGGELAPLVAALERLPRLIGEALILDGEVRNVAEAIADKHHALFLGRGVHFPVALEGALKLKEISYIHAEAYPAGELKHGPLALVDEDMPVIAVAPNNALLEKLQSNLSEVRARGGRLFVFADKEVMRHMNGQEDRVIAVPASDEFTAPAVFTVPLQLLAYHVAVLRGTDVDKPRNLAKSVTVE